MRAFLSPSVAALARSPQVYLCPTVKDDRVTERCIDEGAVHMHCSSKPLRHAGASHCRQVIMLLLI